MKRLAFLALCVLLCGHSWATASIPEPEKLIQIGVEVVEIDEHKSQELGIEWLSSLHVQEAAIPALLTVGTLTRDKVFADLRLLMDEGGADLLANPKLITRDGTTATFHSGGEIPYIVSASLGTVTVEFKPYGVHLQISPSLKSDGSIALNLEAEVSAPDPQNSVTLSGNIVPGLYSRQVRSQITLSPGTTLTLAGLIQNEKQWTRRGIPFLGKIPFLGTLFSRKMQSNKRTSIVVFVTPRVLSENDHG